MKEALREHINSKFHFIGKSRVLIAVSGGLDSVVLTHLCKELKMEIALAHCNFNLRDKESDEDEQFVIDLADDLDLEVFVQNFDTQEFANEHKLSTQMAARRLRYEWFEEIATQLKFDYILTAHHADDNLETFLINLSRGTGLDGLLGIPEQNGKIVRPLLHFSKETIATYAKSNNIQWREDASNTSDKYLRNAFRHHIVPKLKELNPQMLQGLETTIANLSDVQGIVKDRVKQIEHTVKSVKENGEVHFDINEIKSLNNPKAYLFQLLKLYGFTEWNDIANLLDAQSGKQVLSSTHRLINNRNHLILNHLKNNSIDKISVTDSMCKVDLGNGMVLLFDEVDAILGKRTDISDSQDRYAKTIHVDKDLLKFPLTVRGWKEGDYFYPFGMKGRKKLSKYFKDEKMSLTDKENVVLLCSGNHIVWVIGKRADNRFRVTDRTEHILKIAIQQ